MEAGRQLDAIVAEKVIGWKVWKEEKGEPIWSTGEDPDDPDSNPTRKWFCPSTQIADAWLVVEKLRERFGDMEFSFPKGGTRAGQVQFQVIGGPMSDSPDHEHEMHSAWGDTAPHAICLAALKAVGAL